MHRTFVFLFLFFTTTAHSQPYLDIAAVSWQYSPDAAIYGKSKNHLASHYIQGGFNLPIKLFKKDVLMISPQFEWNSLDFRASDAGQLDLYGATLVLTYLKAWKNPKWKTAFASVNRISSDLRDISMKHYQPGGAVLMIYERSDKIKYKLGAYYNAEFFGAFVLPLVGFDWKISNSLILYGIIPRGLVLEYRFTPHFYAGVNWKAITNTYRYKTTDPGDYFKLEESQFRLFADLYFTKHLVLNIEAGHTFLRNFRERSNWSRVSGTGPDRDVNEGLLFKAAFHYRFRLDDLKEKRENQ